MHLVCNKGIPLREIAKGTKWLLNILFSHACGWMHHFWCVCGNCCTWLPHSRKLVVIVFYLYITSSNSLILLNQRISLGLSVVMWYQRCVKDMGYTAHAHATFTMWSFWLLASGSRRIRMPSHLILNKIILIHVKWNPCLVYFLTPCAEVFLLQNTFLVHYFMVVLSFYRFSSILKWPSLRTDRYFYYQDCTFLRIIL